jgi:hypothetical protein
VRRERLCGETAREANIFRLTSNPVIELDPPARAARAQLRVCRIVRALAIRCAADRREPALLARGSGGPIATYCPPGNIWGELASELARDLDYC